MHRVRHSVCCLLFGCLSFSWAITLHSAEKQEENLEVRFQQIAKKALAKLKEAKVESVGVLKFAVRIGDGAFPSSVGTLNMRLAEKMELALVLANPAEPSKTAEQVGVIRTASDTASKIAGANHLTPEGRKLLFTREYPLAWQLHGKAKVTPDALIVGVAQIHADLKSMDIELMLLTRADLAFRPLDTLTVPTDLEDLVDSGESFTTRGLFDDGTLVDEEKKVELVTKRSANVRQETFGKSSPQVVREHPLSPSSNSPIQFELLYGNQIQPIEFRDGAAFVKEPNESQKVSFVVRRKGTDTKRYGVLIRVNGENTLYRERTPDQRSALWILEPNASAFSVLGFQIDNGARQDFRVLSSKESQKRAIDYGSDVGMISITVFQQGTPSKAGLLEEASDLSVLAQGSLPAKTAQTRGELGSSLFAQLMAQDQTRGLLAGDGPSQVAAINTVKFDRDPTPVMATSIRYFSPR